MLKPAVPATVLAVLASGAALAATHGSPRLSAVDLTPLTVRGAGFEARETVRTTLTRNRIRVVKVARANGAGSFTIRFGLVAVEPCRSLSIRAVGSEGSAASYTHRCRPGDPALP